ncbi:MAG: FCD domain-containing protein [Deltaproteobacteria bacterium]|nr:FCD domain-containing protein [Deltaproteobacteria bacterium]
MELNRSGPGSSVRTSRPIKDLTEIERIRDNLGRQPRDLLIFDLATQTGIPMQRLLPLRVKDLKGLKIGDRLPVANRSGNNLSFALVNERISRTLARYLDEVEPDDEDYLFRSQKGSQPLTLSSVTRLVKGWFQSAGLTGLNGVLSLRKTWEVHFKDQSFYHNQARREEAKRVVRPIQVPTRQEAVYQELRRAILSGRLGPGERLVVEELARQMGVSRIPVREAFGRLEASGFIRRPDKKGYTVNELSTEDLQEIIKLRIVLDTMAAEEACRSHSQETPKRLAEVIERWEQAPRDDIDNFIALHREFHYTIYRGANMPILLQMIDYLWNRSSPYLSLRLKESEPKMFTEAIEFHRNVLKGLDKGDLVEIRHWIRTDLTLFAKLFGQWFETSTRLAKNEPYPLPGR